MALGQHLGDHPAALQPVVDALAVERVHAGRGVADQRPVRPGHVGHRPAHRQQRRGRRPELAGELEVLAPLVGVVLHQRLDGDVRGSLRGGQAADADVHLAGAEREDPAVAGQDLAVLATQLEVRADPGVVGHLRGDVGAAGDARRRCRGATPGRAPCPAASARRRPPPRRWHSISKVSEPDRNTTAATRSPSRRTSTARAPSIASAPALIAVVRRWSSSSVRATALPHDGSVPPGQGSMQGLAEAVGAQALVDRVGPQPVLQAEPLQLTDRPRGQPVAAGLVAREHRRVREHDVQTRRAPPRQPPPTPRGRRRRPGRRCAWVCCSPLDCLRAGPDGDSRDRPSASGLEARALLPRERRL